LKIAAPIYFRNNIENKMEFITQLAKKMKIANGTAYTYFSSLLTGKLHDNIPPTYFKVMKEAINITKAPEYLTDLLNKAKKQPVQKIKTIREIRLQHQKKINEIPQTDEIIAQEPDNELTPDPGYEIVSSEIKTLPDKTKVLETKYANGTKIQMPPNSSRRTSYRQNLLAKTGRVAIRTAILKYILNHFKQQLTSLNNARRNNRADFIDTIVHNWSGTVHIRLRRNILNSNRSRTLQSHLVERSNTLAHTSGDTRTGSIRRTRRRGNKIFWTKTRKT